MGELVAVAVLVASLLGSGWEPEAAAYVTAKYPAVCAGSTYAPIDRFWPVPAVRSPYLDRPHVEFESCSPRSFEVDHEYQHAWYFDLDGFDERQMRAVFSPLAEQVTHLVAAGCAETILRRDVPGLFDPPHYNHNLLFCLRRDKRKIPSEYAERYFGWLRTRYAVFIPGVTRWGGGPPAGRTPG